MSDAQYYLDILEVQLKHGRNVLNEEKVEFVHKITQSFHKLLKLYKQYPEMKFVLGNNHFRDIFDDLCPEFHSDNSMVTLLCDYCDCEFSFLNDDVEYSFRMHEQSSEHVKALNEFEKIRFLDASSDICETISNVSASDGIDQSDLTGESSVSVEHDDDEASKADECIMKLNASEPFASVKPEDTFVGDEWVFLKSTKWKHCFLCGKKYTRIAKLMEHVSGIEHTVRRRRSNQFTPVDDLGWILCIEKTKKGISKHTCTLCKASIPGNWEDHANGQKHMKNLEISIRKHWTDLQFCKNEFFHALTNL